jgi:hypothetical protein
LGNFNFSLGHLNALGKKWLVVFSLEEKGIKLFSPQGRGELPSLPRKKGLNWFGENNFFHRTSPQMFEKKIKGVKFLQTNVLYSIVKFFK